ASTVKIHTGITERGKQQAVVGGPQRGGEDIRKPGLAAAIATVAFGHAVVCAELLRSVAGDGGVASDARVGMEKIVDVRPGIRRWAGEVVVVRERDDVGA